MASSNYRSSLRNDSFLDSGSLHLSANGALDDFDFILEAEGEDDERLFANSNASSDLDVLLCGSRGSAGMDFRGSAGMDFQFESLRDSLNAMKVDDADDALQEGDDAQGQENKDVRQENFDEAMRTSGHGVGGRPTASGRRAGQHRETLHRSLPPQRFQLNDVNFDPPSQERRQPRHDQIQSRRSLGDLSLVTSSPASSSSTASTTVAPQAQPLSEAQYNEALQNLAESMKRTEQSRKHVMMQRNLLTPAQQQALTSAKERLNLEQRQQPQQQAQVHQAPQMPHQAPQLPQAVNVRDCGGDPLGGDSASRSSLMAAFFSGSRGTLTTGLEQSRKQLELYMGSQGVVKRSSRL